MTIAAEPLVEVDDLRLHFAASGGWLRSQIGLVKAVDGVTFRIAAGETLGLVGESGSGKSSTGRALLRLTPPTAGKVRFAGRDLAALTATELRRSRRDMQMIFQSPYTSLSPRLKVGDAIREPLDIHRLGTPVERTDRVRELLELVGLDAGAIHRYPHEFLSLIHISEPTRPY